MPLVPENVEQRIAFYTTHLNAWEQHAQEIGLSQQDIDLLREKVAAARAAMLARDIAMETTRSLTAKMHLAVEEMHALGSVDILKVRIKARMEHAPDVYAKANLPLPRKASPVGVPEKPRAFETQLLADGSVELSWKCRTPGDNGGTIYEVTRRIPMPGATGTDRGAAVILGMTSIKRFVDDSLPAGTATAFYEVTPMRGASGVASERTTRGATGTTVVNLGVRTSGVESPRLAA